MLGYRLYRSETPVQADAVLITPHMIEATNSSDVTTYYHNDMDIEDGHTYYYWLEAITMISSEWFGPAVITISDTAVDDNLAPVENLITGISPNPFRAGVGARIDLALKTYETGRVSICNLRGQTVRGFAVGGATSSLLWDGRNEQGSICSPGVYFVRLQSGGRLQTRKILLLK